MNQIDFAKLRTHANEWSPAIKNWRRDLIDRFKGNTPVILEISGLDSLGAAILSAKNLKNVIFIPTLAVIPSEYGNRTKAIKQAEKILNNNLESNRITPFINLREFKLWSLLDGLFIPGIIKAFGTYSPCIGCHVYVHTLRILLAKMIGAKTIVSGERINHDSKFKINQTAASLSAHEHFCSENGIELHSPLREISSGEEIRSIIGKSSKYNKNIELTCVFQSNIHDPWGYTFDTGRLEQYYNEFSIPAAKSYIDWLTSCWNDPRKPCDENELFALIRRRVSIAHNPNPST